MPLLRGWTDERVEQIVGNLLRVGVLIAAAVVLIGGILYVIENGRQPFVPTKLAELPPDLRSPQGVFADAGQFQSRGVIQLGLLLLILTPVARVVFSVVAFALERDGMYVVFTLVVLGILLYSLFSGGKG
jgi:uncharacterized membrane protein